MRASFVSVDGIRTRFLHAGQGPALLMLHGIGLSGDIFMRNLDGLGRDFAVYAPDLIGHGFTEAADFGTEPPQQVMARHVIGFAETLGIERYGICGSSYGALVAALAYFEQPDRVQSLILTGSGSVFHSSQDQKVTLRASAANALKAMTDPTLQSCRSRMEAIVYDPSTVPVDMLPVQLTAYALPDRVDAYRSAIEGSIRTMELPEARVLGRLEQMDVPTLVIVGRDDVRASWDSHAAGVARMTIGDLRIYERCGHLPFLEHVEQFENDVRAFFSTVRG